MVRGVEVTGGRYDRRIPLRLILSVDGTDGRERVSIIATGTVKIGTGGKGGGWAVVGLRSSKGQQQGGGKG